MMSDGRFFKLKNNLPKEARFVLDLSLLMQDKLYVFDPEGDPLLNISYSEQEAEKGDYVIRADEEGNPVEGALPEVNKHMFIKKITDYYGEYFEEVFPEEQVAEESTEDAESEESEDSEE
jgi:hypothetical protein